MIFKMLQKSDRTLLPGTMLPRDNEELSTVLGDPLTSSTHLYLELQNTYIPVSLNSDSDINIM